MSQRRFAKLDKLEEIKKWYQEYFVVQCRVSETRKNVEWLIEAVEHLRVGKIELEKRLEFAEEQLEEYENEDDDFHFDR